MQHGDLCARAYVSWNRDVETMIDCAGGTLAQLFPGVGVELIAEYVGLVRFIGLAMRLINPSSVNKYIRTLGLWLVQHAPVYDPVKEALFTRVTWELDIPPVLRLLCVKIAACFTERLSSRRSVMHLLKARSGTMFARFSYEDVCLFNIGTLSSGVVELALLHGWADRKPKLMFDARVLNQLGKMAILSWFSRQTPMPAAFQPGEVQHRFGGHFRFGPVRGRNHTKELCVVMSVPPADFLETAIRAFKHMMRAVLRSRLYCVASAVGIFRSRNKDFCLHTPLIVLRPSAMTLDCSVPMPSLVEEKGTSLQRTLVGRRCTCF